MKTVGKTDLVDQLKDRYGYIKRSSNEFLSDLFDLILWNVEQGNAVSLHGIGLIDIVVRAPRKCLHPITGEPFDVPSHWAPRFYPGVQLKNAVRTFEESVSQEEKLLLESGDRISVKTRCLTNAGVDEEDCDGDE